MQAAFQYDHLPPTSYRYTKNCRGWLAPASGWRCGPELRRLEGVSEAGARSRNPERTEGSLGAAARTQGQVAHLRQHAVQLHGAELGDKRQYLRDKIVAHQFAHLFL